ncbi:lycopene cyclase domain-containing protein [Metallosphaera cuprina]|uniref:Lycopene cyclase domain-containing protein n=1 Tax=Metallosphaera cuprina (strain Ar-4) TaxID=1006006 RepID=F4G2U5_METCR|nr:lycopene cyclase domain-containing protein [Metallosphaera cuprina]AEB95143.1 conserved hypothetical protein [Metallosphaera cuprina Ar-4]
MMFLPTLVLSLLYVRRDYVALMKSIALVSPIYLIWDYFATLYHSWSFNENYVLGVYVTDLPIEEVMFFFVTPFATLMIYDFVTRFEDREIRFVPKVALSLSLTSLILALVTARLSYTSIDLIYLSFSLLITFVLDRRMLSSLNFWRFIGLSYVPFLVFDYLLTSLPIVEYGRSITNVRVLTIPIEDFVYSFSMLTFYTLFYRRFKRRERVEQR